MNIFLSTPISSFESLAALNAYRAEVLGLIVALREKHAVCAEIERFAMDPAFDTPEKSIADDLKSVRESDLFIMHYPICVPTSALIELGFAIAEDKKIIIIAPQIKALPYLVQEVPKFKTSAAVIEKAVLDEECIAEILRKIDSLYIG